MSNKGLTFLIILLLLLCGATFGAFYLKIHPEMPLSQKIFGKKVVQVNDENTNTNNAPIQNNNGYVNTNVVENTVPPVSNNTQTNENVKVTPQGDPNDVVIVDTKPEEKIPTPTPKPTPTPTPEPTPTPKEDSTVTKITLTLKKGSKGPEVKILQQFLIDNEYLTGANMADGIFGPITETAVKKFQTEYKLTSDGIVGGKTRDTINEILASN